MPETMCRWSIPRRWRSIWPGPKTCSGYGPATVPGNRRSFGKQSHYLTATTPGQRHAVETIIEDAQHELLRRAHPPAVITEEDGAVLADGYKMRFFRG